MLQLFYTVREAAAASLVWLPVLLILNHLRLHSRKIAALYFLFGFYLCGMYAVAGLPNIRYIRYEPNFCFIPFGGMLSDLSGAVLNIILFIPLGMFLFILWKPFRSIQHLILFGFCTSLVIEFLQIFTLRATDVNDLITNTAGTLTGYGLGLLTAKQFPSVLCRNRLSDLPIVIGSCTAIMFFFQPVIWHILS